MCPSCALRGNVNTACPIHGYSIIEDRTQTCFPPTGGQTFTNCSWPINDIEHTKTKVKSPQTNGICERFHKTILQEFYQVTFRKKIYEDIDQLQNDLDLWIDHYNNQRTHQGKVCEGRTPMQTLEDGKEIWKDKFVD